MSEPIHIISLGAGVQSSTMALMAARGEITPMPQFAVFSDTGCEPIAVYEWLNTLTSLLPFPVIIAKRNVSGTLEDHLITRGKSQIPAYFKDDAGNLGLGKRQCTTDWKLDPLRRKIRETIGAVRKRLPAGTVQIWIGISTDEISRAKDSRFPWIEHRFPLIERGISRTDCRIWLSKHGHNPPKSACFFCPFKSEAEWRKSKSIPDEWGRLLRIDAMLNKRSEFLHRSCTPLAEVDFSTAEERGQMTMFNNECSGICGV